MAARLRVPRLPAAGATSSSPESSPSHPGLADGHAPIGPDSPLWALFLGFEHERIHLETSSVLMRELPLELVRRPAEFPRAPPERRGSSTPTGRPPGATPSAGRDYPANPLVGGARRAGVDREGPRPSRPSAGTTSTAAGGATSEAFAASRHLITNGEFHAFVAAGGYREERWWTEDGWRWRGFRNVKWPTFWVPCGPQGSHQYLLRTIFELVGDAVGLAGRA